MGEFVTISVSDLKAVIEQTVEVTLKKQRGLTMKVSEYAKTHRISRTTVYAMIARGELIQLPNKRIQL